MATCPQNDVHSVYIDGELPEKYRAEYEAHVVGCVSCQTELAKLRRLRTLFMGENTDGSASTQNADSAFLTASFMRLQTKLRYSRTVGVANDRRIRAFPWAISAAAVIFALVLVPVRTHTSNADAAVTVIASAELEPLAEKSVVIDGNISHTEFSSLAVADVVGGNSAAITDKGDRWSDSTEAMLAQAPSARKTTTAETATVSAATISAAPGARTLMEQRTVRAQTVSNGMRRSLQSVDVFRPTNISAPAVVSRVITVDGNLSHEALSQLAVTESQDGAR